MKFKLPPKGTLKKMGDDDPLDYYYNPLVGWLYEGRINQALSLIEDNYGTILEIGYGSGLLLPTLLNMAQMSVHGIDIASEPDEIKTSANLKKIDIMDYSSSFQFDLIVGISVFEHIKPTKELMDKISSLLKDGGHLLVGMPRVDGLMNKLFPLIGVKDINDYHITNHREFLKACPLRLVKLVSYYGLYYNMLFTK